MANVTIKLANPITSWTSDGLKAAMTELKEYMDEHRLAVAVFYDGTYSYLCWRTTGVSMMLLSYNAAMTVKREACISSVQGCKVVVTNLTPVA